MAYVFASSKRYSHDTILTNDSIRHTDGKQIAHQIENLEEEQIVVIQYDANDT